MSRRKNKAPAEPFEIDIDGLSHDGSGVGRDAEGKVVFVDLALPGERVLAQPLRRRRKFNGAIAVKILKASPDRVEPPCPHFGVCGGCNLQHLSSLAQIQFKQDQLREQLQFIGRVAPMEWLPPMTTATEGYRRKARLGVRLVPQKGGVLVGFRERRSSFLTGLNECRVLDTRFSSQLPALKELVESLSCADRIPQIEVAAGDKEAAIVLRHIEPLNKDDIDKLCAFGEASGLIVYLQPGGPDTIHAVWPRPVPVLSYRIPRFGLEMQFRPTDFTQVNADINQRMVAEAVDFLDLSEDDSVLDLFCGLGNFTLPIARTAGQVLGIEADEDLVRAAAANARSNGISNVSFRSADLYDEVSPEPWHGFVFNKLLLDPPRTGAIEVIKQLPEHGGPERIVYISCNPATLARDANVLVNAKGYNLVKAGVMDMFPHTGHVESIAVFTLV